MKVWSPEAKISFFYLHAILKQGGAKQVRTVSQGFDDFEATELTCVFLFSDASVLVSFHGIKFS